MPRPSKEEMQAHAARMREIRQEKIQARKTEAQLEAERKMAMAAEPEPLPDPSEVLQMSEHTWLGEPRKSLYIPSWYKAHKRNVWVTQNGKPLGFRVGDVLAHRRWAIKGDGELMDQVDFEPAWERYMEGMTLGKVEPRLQHIPRVERFVNTMPDPRGGPGFVAIGFDPHLPPEPDDGLRYNPIEDAIVSIKEQIDRGQSLERKAQLADMLAKGDINGETFEREMRALAPVVEIQPEEAAQPVA